MPEPSNDWPWPWISLPDPPRCSECASSEGLCVWHQYDRGRYR